MLAAFFCVSFAIASTAPPPVRVLFLGDRGHHEPEKRFEDFKAPMAREGIVVTYTEDVAQLNPNDLAKFDVLLVYANIDAISKEGEKAILDYVASGHGLVPLHCASYCFRNSDAWVDLVGAQFLSHGTGTFRTEIVDFDHSITRGLLPFESWDETYVHTRHSADKHVLEIRAEGEKREPWTWTRTHDKGRVFYTAWGHDARTWTNAGFQQLVARGIRWAAGERFEEKQRVLAPFEYEDARVPLYPTRGGHAEQSKMQKPLAPADEREWLNVEAGFDVELFAADPDLRPALTMAFDERGRTWIAESVDYPNDKHALGQGHDSIKILEDTDGDGRADTFTTFAEGLSIPTSLCFARGGVIVASAPDVLFLKDTDGDGKADVREVLFTGFGVYDTHAGPSNFRYGLDGWIWGTVGYAGFDGTVGGVHHAFSQGVFRFKSDGSALEFIGSTTNNTWGLGMSETGEWFVSTANHDQMNYVAIPNRYYETVNGWHGRGVAYIADYERFHPITTSVRQVDWHGMFTAAAGSALYTARLYPKRYWNSVAFVCEPTGHLVHESELEAKGSSFVAHDGWNLLASRDEWCAPIQAEVGPDGCVWVLDRYSYIVQHNPTPPGFTTGKGAAYETPLRDKSHTRVWRVVPHGVKMAKREPLDITKPEELVARLADDNMLWRLHAERLLVERGLLDIAPALMHLIEVSHTDGVGNDPGALHALSVLSQLGSFERNGPELKPLSRAASRNSQALRASVLHLSPRAHSSRKAILDGGDLDDGDALVRREALLALSEMPSDDDAGRRVFEMLEKPENAEDPWIPDAAIVAGARHASGFLAAALAFKPQHAAPSANDDEHANALPNADFELGANEKPERWAVRTYSGRAEHHWVEGGRSGHCLEIASTSGADSSWFVDAHVEKNRRYELSGWIRTENVEGAMGALFNVHASPEVTVTAGVKGTSNWTRVALMFDSLDRDEVSINCLFGGWGQSKGKAWFDDVKLVRVRSAADLGLLSKSQARALDAVTRHYASSGPKDTIIATLLALKTADAKLATWVLDALAGAWPERISPSINADDATKLRELAHALPADPRVSLCVLARRFGHAELFTDEAAALALEMRKLAVDRSLSADRRVDAAERMLRLDESEASIDAVGVELGAEQDPEWTSGALTALGTLRSPSAAAVVLAHWKELSPERRRAAIALFAQRDVWAAQLLDAVESGSVPRGDLSPQDWRTLELAKDPALAQRAARLHGEKNATTSAARAAVLERFLPAASKKGDAARGHELFQKTCMVCHTYRGEGGIVGPALDGFGVRDPKDVLAEIVDPNRSVEANYRLWVVRTKDDLLLSGRLVNESKTSVELLDATGKKTSIARADIDAIVAQNVSVMPEGLIDAFTLDDVAALLAYLATK